MAAQTPNWDSFTSKYPHSLLETSGSFVGLPDGQMGNSEVGHMNIGCGRVIQQDLPKINQAVSDSSLEEKALFKDFITKLKASGGACHIAGLVSNGGVHAHQNHIIHLAKIISAQNIKVNIHAFLDGRDTAPTSGVSFINNLNAQFSDDNNIQIATLSGRYYAMDRDNRWERVKLAHDAIIDAQAPKFTSTTDAIQASYDKGVNDEFIIPTAAANYSGAKDGDGFIMANFRADRAREISQAIFAADFDGFVRIRKINFASQISMTAYSDEIVKYLPALFTNETPKNTLSDVIAANGLKQLHAAETEKYAHVTFFFNGGVETPKKGEERILIPSPKVATYDLQPEMSAPELTQTLIEQIESKQHDFIVVNFANPDMVGHTGIWEAAISAVEEIDKDLGLLAKSALANDFTMFVTADHGNIEKMFDDENNEAYTAHSLNPVPFLMISPNSPQLENGKLADIAPTILDVMNISKPAEMTGNSLIKK
jgi:2,3-bisphosphoglycerate-independent phosphoglycerate mutase